MTNRFLISVAAVALIAGTGFASAQGTGNAPSGGAAAQQSAPSAAPMSRDSGSDTKGSDQGMKATQSDQKAPGAAKSQRAEEGMQKKGMGSEMNDNAKGAKESGKEMKAEGRDSGKNAQGREGQTGNMNAQKGAADSKAQTTTGQAGAGAKLSGEQRTKITTVIKEQHVQPVTNVNFSISVGTRVPRNVGFHPLPVEIVTIYPDWRGYEFFLVSGQIVVVNPRTLEIVAVIEA